jgi:hypothetical protein
LTAVQAIAQLGSACLLVLRFVILPSFYCEHKKTSEPEKVHCEVLLFKNLDQAEN